MDMASSRPAGALGCLIAEGQFSDDYVRAVRTIGQTHARIGLEPRWYIGGYAVVMRPSGPRGDRLDLAQGLACRQGRFKPGLARPSRSLMKAILLDMDFAISIYLETLEAERQTP